MTDVVLMQLPFWGPGCPPLCPALLKSYINQHGISCRIFDINIHAYFLRGDKYYDAWDLKNGYYFFQGSPEKMLAFYEHNQALFLSYIGQIAELKPKVVGCTCHNTSIVLSKMFLKEYRHYFPGARHILGGPEVARFMHNSDDLLKEDYIDAVCLDEGEKSLVQYYQVVTGQKNGSVPGVNYKTDGKIVKGGATDPIRNLDDLPFPDFDDFDLEYYYKPNSMPSYSSRGCINKCVYCSGRAFMKRFRTRSGKRMYEEIAHLKKKYPEVDYIRLSDNVSNANIKELEIFCDLMIASNLGVRWTLDNAVIRKEMRTPLYKKLKKAGCFLVAYGLETPSPQLLEKIGKHFSKGVDIVKVLKEGKKAGIYISTNVMFGLPGETAADFQNLIDFAVKNKRAFNAMNPSLTFCEFYPGSMGYENPEKYGIDMHKGILFWESLDKTNTYPIRMERFEKFCKISKKHKFDNLFHVEELPNKYALLFEYHVASDEPEKAKEMFRKIPTEQLTTEIKRTYNTIADEKIDLPEASADHESKMKARLPFSDALIRASLVKQIEELEKMDVFDVPGQRKWKTRVRSIMHRIIGYDRISAKINSTLALMKIMDAKLQLRSVSHLETGEKS